MGLKLLSFKIALLVALTSVKRVVQHPNPFYQPKVFTSDQRSRVIQLPALTQIDSNEPWLHKLLPARSLRAYVHCRHIGQLFVFRSRALSPQRLSHCLVEAMSLTYEVAGKRPLRHQSPLNSWSCGLLGTLEKGTCAPDLSARLLGL